MAVLALVVGSVFPVPGLCGSAAPLAANNANFSRLAQPGAEGKLVYAADAKGNTLLDFSHCGYLGGGVALPEFPVRRTLHPAPGAEDDTARIQAALDEVSRGQPDVAGARGAVLLKRGQYRIGGTLRIAASGVVLRGEGSSESGTVLLATGTKRRTVIEVRGASGPKEVNGSRQLITSDYIPVGARTFEVRDGAKLKAGDTVVVSRNGNQAWIHEIGMDRITPRPGDPTNTKQWAPFALPFDRVITQVQGNRITVDAPLACAIEARWGGGEVWRYESSRIGSTWAAATAGRGRTTWRGTAPAPSCASSRPRPRTTRSVSSASAPAALSSDPTAGGKARAATSHRGVCISSNWKTAWARRPSPTLGSNAPPPDGQDAAGVASTNGVLVSDTSEPAPQLAILLHAGWSPMPWLRE
ncbi:MAG: hypothetical protein FJ399_03175 [Verrucomicrobia bacterium]|nr:hypothetical protein [Verrucomicrobiota bacterium]